jgi:hypothetical protein
MSEIGIAEHREARGSPILQKQINHKDHQCDRDDQRLDNFFHAFGNRLRLTFGDAVQAFKSGAKAGFGELGKKKPHFT